MFTIFIINACFAVFTYIPVIMLHGWPSILFLGIQTGGLFFQGLSSNLPITKSILIGMSLGIGLSSLIKSGNYALVYIVGLAVITLINYILYLRKIPAV